MLSSLFFMYLSDTESQTACNSYTWAVNGQTYTLSGSYTFVGTNAAGCSDESRGRADKRG